MSILLCGIFPLTALAAELSGPVKVGATTATVMVISWQTDVETGTRVSYGAAADQLTERVEGGVGTRHEVTLTGLKPGTKYFYAVGTARKKLATGEFVTSGSPVSGSAPASSSPVASSPVSSASSVIGKIFSPKPKPEAAPPTRMTWGNMASLADHFARHGGDFQAKDADDYARMAWQFGQQAKAGGLQVKVDEDGTRRVYDAKSGGFAAYNADGTTKTYFKPNSRDYFARQPGRLVNTRTP
ncbi:MAG: fibronectin type III domain-containing protein [Chthoniobacter sp.]|nr:fibronectin type III domain-containing protein [Chthoniobacter sp.]